NFQPKFTFGSTPFFTVSGGLSFSPLRKREFVRVQGFERDQQGNLVMKDGKPNLTTVVGLKESSPMRITPAIFLNGRLRSWDNRVVDGLHLSLGITAKNDNKGTDVEFLMGPSLRLAPALASARYSPLRRPPVASRVGSAHYYGVGARAGGGARSPRWERATCSCRRWITPRRILARPARRCAKTRRGSATGSSSS